MSTYTVASTQAGQRRRNRPLYSVWNHFSWRATAHHRPPPCPLASPTPCHLLFLLGLGLRLFHYLREPSVWHDEAALILNVLGKSFGELLGPLRCDLAAPPLFLWVERAVSLVLGSSTLALRLVPLLASCASLGLVVWVARRVLPPRAALWAVLLFACSDHLLWHACEAKSYSVDVLCAAGLIALFCRCRSWGLQSQLLLYAVLAPVVIFVAYPGGFLCGGLLAALLPDVWRQQRRRTWIAYVLLGFIVVGAFVLLALGPAAAQRTSFMEQCWLKQFPCWERPWTVPPWLLFSTLEMVRYCCAPTGQFLSVLTVVGAVSLRRAGHGQLVTLATVPMVLALLAACLGKYPYGGARVMVYAAPAVVLFIGAGVPVVCAWLRVHLRPAVLAVFGLLLAPAAWSAYRVAVPWPRADCAGAAGYVLAARQTDEPVTCNHYEYEYYFRQLGPALQPLLGVERQPGERLWVVLSGASPEHRQQIVAALPPKDWEVLDRREFPGTTVWRLRRPANAAAPPVNSAGLPSGGGGARPAPLRGRRSSCTLPCPRSRLHW